MRYMKKRFVWALLLLAMFWSVLSSQSNAAPTTANKNAQTSGKASSMRLESMEGTVKIKNASGKAMTARDDMRLYNGYGIATEKDSAAYINLDDTKVVKLDASSSGLVMQAGKKLEFALSKGSLLFDVSKPLEDDESLNIRTSTMVTGVRGTAGWIEVIDEDTCRIALLEGEVMINSVHPETGEIRQQKIVGGQIATIVFHRDSTDGAAGFLEDQTIGGLIDGNIILEHALIVRETGLTVESLDENNIPEFVKEVVEENPELQQRIKEETDLDVDEIIGKQKLESFENTGTENTQTDTQQDPVIQEPVEEQEAQTESEETEADEEDEESSSSSSGSGSDSDLSSGSGSDSGAEAEPSTPVGTVTLTNPTLDEINTELATEGVTAVIANYNVNTTLVPAANSSGFIFASTAQTLTMNVDSDVTLDSALNLEVNSGVTVKVNSGALINNGTIAVGIDGVIVVGENGTLVNNGTFDLLACKDMVTILGKFKDTSKTSLYVLETDVAGKVISYDAVNNVLGYENGTGWKDGMVYTLQGVQSESDDVSLANLNESQNSALSVVLDLNGITLDMGNWDIIVNQNATLTIKDSFGGGYLRSKSAKVIHVMGGNLVLESGCIQNNGDAFNTSGVIKTYTGTVTINGGVVDGNGSNGITDGMDGVYNFNIIVNGGIVKGGKCGIWFATAGENCSIQINGGMLYGGEYAIMYAVYTQNDGTIIKPVISGVNDNNAGCQNSIDAPTYKGAAAVMEDI